MFAMHHPLTPTPIPSPHRGRGDAPARHLRLTPRAGNLPAPSVGEGRGGGATRHIDRSAA